MAVQTIVASVKHDCSHRLGQFLDETDYDVLIDSDTDFYIPASGIDNELTEQRVGFIFRKGYFTLEEQQGAYEGLCDVPNTPSNNRGLASGPKVDKVGNRDWVTACQWDIINLMQRGKTPLPGFDPIQEILDKYKDGDIDSPRGQMWLYGPTKKDSFSWNEWLENTRQLSIEEQKKASIELEKKYISISTYASPVHSGVAGSQDRYPRFPYARLCAYNRDNPEKFAKAFPFLEKLSEGFREHMPNRWAVQKAATESIAPEFVVGNTVFSTITVNRTWRTAAHFDAGDLSTGFSNLSAITDGVKDYTGCYLVLPEYRAAINLRPGDLLLVANHDIMHGNTEIEGERLSVVAYFREGLLGTGSYEYEQARFEYVKEREADKDHPERPHDKWNGVSAGMWDTQNWYDYLEAKLGSDVLKKYHPESVKEESIGLF